MFLRWKKRKRRSRQTKFLERTTMSAVMVESYWSQGRAKQRVVKHLGSIREEHISYLHSREQFGERVNSNLDSLKIPRQQKALIIAKIQEVVPKPIPT